MQKTEIRKDLLFFFILVAAVGLGNGFSDTIFSNYFKEVYHATATQRAFVEFPREMPGVLCAFAIAAMSALGDLKIAVIAQVCSCVGLIAMGLFTPSFGVMLIFLFISSCGMHLFMPIQDSLGMGLAEKDKIGERIGQYISIKTASGFVAGIIVFFGFRSGVLSFQTPIKWVFVLASIIFAVAAFSSVMLLKTVPKELVPVKKRKFKLVFRKEYKYYYLLTVLRGVQKQVALVFGAWVIVDLLGKGADIMSLLIICASFLGIFFTRYLGRWLDRFGVKRMMYLDALSFIFVYVLYGITVWLITGDFLPKGGWMVLCIYLLFILDRLSMQVGIVQAVYLRSIAISPEDVTPTLSTGLSLDHMVSVLAAQISGLVWTLWGAHWVFFIAAFFSLGNLFVAFKMEDDKSGKSIQ